MNSIPDECQNIRDEVDKLCKFANILSEVGLKDTADIIYGFAQNISLSESNIETIYYEIINDKVRDAEAMSRATLAAALKKD